MILSNPWKRPRKLSKKGAAAPHMQVPVKIVGIAAPKKGKKKGPFKENEYNEEHRNHQKRQRRHNRGYMV